MQATQSQASFAITQEKMVALVESIIQRRTPSIPIPPPRRFDSLVRQTLNDVFGPLPDPWLAAEDFQRVALNPQPLPPRARFLTAVAEQVVNRAELLQEIAAALSGEPHGMVKVGAYVSEFADEFCGNGFRLVWPHPGPHPEWFSSKLDGGDLLVMAGHFSRAAKEAFGPDLQRSLATAGEKFAQAGLARIQSA